MPCSQSHIASQLFCSFAFLLLPSLIDSFSLFVKTPIAICQEDSPLPTPQCSVLRALCTMSFTSTRESLLSLVDDLELISREMLENLIAPKARRMSAREHQELTDLLVAKDAELRSTLETARQQGRVQVEIEALRAEVARKDEAVRGLQMRLKEAEGILAASIYQAKQKLRAVDRAKDSPVSSEELIKYAHRISASNAVCAPLNWQQGDPRRPYPTGILC